MSNKNTYTEIFENKIAEKLTEHKGEHNRTVPLCSHVIVFKVELQRLYKGFEDKTLSGRVITPPKALNRK